MKVIDLLNKIANGEEVKFIYKDNRFSTSPGLSIHNDTCGNWISIEINSDTHESLDYGFLKDEVEIIGEDKKIPEKLDLYEETQNIIRENNYKLVYHDIHKCIVSLKCKYNEIIDYLESKGDE